MLLKLSSDFDWTFWTCSFNLISLSSAKVFHHYTERKQNNTNYISTKKKKKLPCMCGVFSRLRSKIVWPKSHNWNKGFWETGYFCYIRVQCSRLRAAVLIAWFIPAHLVSPTLPSLQMIAVQNHLRLKNPAQSILFSPAAQGCKKIHCISLLLYIFKLDLGMTIYYSACYGLPKINDFLTQTFRLSKSSFHAARG